MATANPTPPDHGEDNFVLELKRVREQIKQKFFEVIDFVKARESKLLKELDTILASYHSYRDEFEKQNLKIRELEETRNFLNSKTMNKSLNENIITQISEELASIMSPTEPKTIRFGCDNSKMFAELDKLGELVENVIVKVDYKSKVRRVVSVCKKGIAIERLNCPWGVTFDGKTGNIYVADQGNNCVKVFDSFGRILFKFGDSDDDGKMIKPSNLVINGDRILISNGVIYDKSSNFILIYQLNGSFVSKIGKYGKGYLEFNNPLGLACNESNGDIYICDYGNNRIQILSKEFQFKSQFGADKLVNPRDLKLSKEYIFILDVSYPCIHLYDYNLILYNSVVSRGKGMQIIHSNCFYLDDSNNILISDYNAHSIQIFNSQFESIHEINTSTHPMGVVVDNQGRVIVVCQANRNCLQIFYNYSI